MKCNTSGLFIKEWDLVAHICGTLTESRSFPVIYLHCPGIRKVWTVPYLTIYLKFSKNDVIYSALSLFSLSNPYWSDSDKRVTSLNLREFGNNPYQAFLLQRTWLRRNWRKIQTRTFLENMKGIWRSDLVTLKQNTRIEETHKDWLVHPWKPLDLWEYRK